jgi:hypothetical protein
MRVQPRAEARDLFRHVSADKAEAYRAILDMFAWAKRQYRLQLRPDEVLAEVRWPGRPPSPEEVNAALVQLRDWGNLESHPDTSRVSTLSDFYRARFLYRLSHGGEAVERGPSTWGAADAPATLEDRLRALVEEPVADSEEGRRTAVRHGLARRLLDDPVVYIDNLAGCACLLREPAWSHGDPAVRGQQGSPPRAWRWWMRRGTHRCGDAGRGHRRARHAARGERRDTGPSAPYTRSAEARAAVAARRFPGIGGRLGAGRP